MTRAAWLGRVPAHMRPASCVIALLVFGCGHAPVPDPKNVLVEYNQAIERGDSATLRDMLSERAKQDWSSEQVDKVIKRDRAELRVYAQGFGKMARTEANARFELLDGSEVELELQTGRYGITSAGDLPSGASTPQGALVKLRGALLHNRYGALLRSLTPSSRRVLEEDMKSLIVGLSNPRTLEVQVQGESATANLVGGHIVQMRRVLGMWYVENFR
jgi:hypothetical protein